MKIYKKNTYFEKPQGQISGCSGALRHAAWASSAQIELSQLSLNCRCIHLHFLSHDFSYKLGIKDQIQGWFYRTLKPEVEEDHDYSL